MCALGKPEEEDQPKLTRNKEPDECVPPLPRVPSSRPGGG